MNFTVEQKKSIDRIRKKYDFPKNIKWWGNDNELFLKLNDNTVFGIHSSGLVTKHINY